MAIMALGPSGNPYRFEPVSLQTPQSYTSIPGNLWMVNCGFVMAGILLTLAAAMACMTVSFVFWAVREGNVPLFGMFMAASMRAGAAIAFAIPGLLLLMASLATRRAAIGSEPAALKRMQNLHWMLLSGTLAVFFVAVLAIVMFFTALGFSSM